MVDDPQLRAFIQEASSQAAEKAAARAADDAVARWLRHFGVDVSDQNSLNSFRADLIHAHKSRRRDEGRTAFALRVVGSITIAVLVAMASGLASWIGGVFRDIHKALGGH